jgi:hypothetical protein
MDRWDAAMGNNNVMWGCLEAFARLGGFRGMKAALNDSYTTGDAREGALRPWRWWAEAAREATAQGQHALAGRIFLFAFHFTMNIYPRMNQMTQAEVGLCYPEDGIYQAIARNAAASLRHLPPNMIVRNAIIDQVNVADALKAATMVAAS